MLRSVLLPVLASVAALATAAHAEPAKSAAKPSESANAKALAASEKQWASYNAQATGCGFTTATVDAIQRRELTLQRKLVKLAEPRLVVAPVREAPVGCSGPFHGEVVGATMVATWEWLTRLDYYAAFTGTTDWPQGIANLGGFSIADQRDLKTGLTDSLVKTNGKETMDQRSDSLRQEVVAVLMLMCRERRPGATNCPTLPDSLKGQEANARLRLAEIERAASQLADASKRDQIDAVGMAWRLQKDAKDTSAQCAAGDRVIYPHAKATKRGMLPGQVMLFLRKWDNMTPANASNSADLVTVEETADGYRLLYSTELKVGFRDPVKRKFIPCEAF